MSETPYKKIHVVINPASGKDEPVLNVLNDVFHQYEDIEWTISVTKKYGDATAQAREAAEGGADLVAGYGGDGTQHEIANGILGTTAVMCRSGGRSAFSINMLAKAGFSNVYNIIDGFEGDTVTEPESVYHGKRLKNGWKNSAPWTYDLDPALVWIPTGEELDTLRTTLDI